MPSSPSYTDAEALLPASKTPHRSTLHGAARIAAFVVVFSILPMTGAVLAALKGSSRLPLLKGPLAAFPSFSAISIAQPVLTSIAVSIAIGLGSFLAWSRSASWCSLRVLRTFVTVVSVGLVLYPAFGATVPVIRSLPLWVVFAVMLVVNVALWAAPFARAGWREWVFVGVVSTAFYFNPVSSVSRAELSRLAGRDLNANDVVVLGFDSMSGPEVRRALVDHPAWPTRQFVFTNASTPFAGTNAAWRTILSGAFPPAAVLPGDNWGRQHGHWLPDELVAHGYRTMLFQDDATTNVFASDESIGIGSQQGWKWMTQTFLWRTIFPLSELGGAWWLKLGGAPVHFAARYSYSPEAFQEEAIRRLAEMASGGPVFFATHSCYAHTPIRLNWAEITELDRWWSCSPDKFEGGPSYFTQGSTANYQKLVSIRTESARQLIHRTLDRLAELGVIGHASVFVLSDHGQRASWVSKAMTHHVMLTTFLPGTGDVRFVDAPVSLADLAPTIRGLIGLPRQTADGLPLPFEQHTNRGPRDLPQLSPAALQAGARALFDPRNMAFAGNVKYHDDGTFSISPVLRQQIEAVMDVESRNLRALNYWASKAESSASGSN